MRARDRSPMPATYPWVFRRTAERNEHERGTATTHRTLGKRTLDLSGIRCAGRFGRACWVPCWEPVSPAKAMAGLRGQNLELRAVAGEEAFVLKDTAGKVALLGRSWQGRPSAHAFLRPEGKAPSIARLFGGAGPEIRMSDDKGEVLVHFFAKDSTSAQLTLPRRPGACAKASG